MVVASLWKWVNVNFWDMGRWVYSTLMNHILGLHTPMKKQSHVPKPRPMMMMIIIMSIETNNGLSTLEKKLRNYLVCFRILFICLESFNRCIPKSTLIWRLKSSDRYNDKYYPREDVHFILSCVFIILEKSPQ